MNRRRPPNCQPPKRKKDNAGFKYESESDEGVLPPCIGINSNPIYSNYSVCYIYDSFGFNGQYIIANTHKESRADSNPSPKAAMLVNHSPNSPPPLLNISSY